MPRSAADAVVTPFASFDRSPDQRECVGPCGIEFDDNQVGCRR